MKAKDTLFPILISLIITTNMVSACQQKQTFVIETLPQNKISASDFTDISNTTVELTESDFTNDETPTTKTATESETDKQNESTESSIMPTTIPSVTTTFQPTTSQSTSETATSPYRYPTPVVAATISDNGVLVTWDKISDRSLVGYKVVASQSNPNPKFSEDGYFAWITDENTTSCLIQNGAKYTDGDIINFSGGTTYFFSVTAVYTGSNPFYFPDPLLYPSDGWVMLAGNAIKLTMPGDPYQPSLVTHPSVTFHDPVIGDDSVYFNWDRTSDDTGFYCYHLHVEITKDDQTYGTGCEIYDPDQTDWTISLSEFVAGSGTYTVSFTTVYKDNDGQTYNELSEAKSFELQ